MIQVSETELDAVMFSFCLTNSANENTANAWPNTTGLKHTSYETPFRAISTMADVDWDIGETLRDEIETFYLTASISYWRTVCYVEKFLTQSSRMHISVTYERPVML